jgi:hypothetical protein
MEMLELILIVQNHNIYYTIIVKSITSFGRRNEGCSSSQSVGELDHD